MKKIFEGQSCIAEYNAEKKRIIYTFEGYANIDEHKTMYLKALDFLKENPTISFIMDFRKMKGTFTMLSEWVIETMRPAVELGLKKEAMILNNDVFTSFAANDALKKIKLIQIQVFKEMKEAEEWIEK